MLTNTRAMTSGYRLQQWAGVLQKQKDSGLNVKSFCEETGIREHRYYYWQRKLRAVANEKLSKEQNDETGLLPARNDTPVVWAEVNINAYNPTNSPVNNNIKICRDGWTVMVESGFDTELLSETLRVVSRVCC